jgi:hypothetical protein
MKAVTTHLSPVNIFKPDILMSILMFNLSVSLQPFGGPWGLFQFLDLLQSRYDTLNGGSARRKAHRIPQTQNKRTQISMQVGLEPTIPVLERAKTVHALDREATDRPILMLLSNVWLLSDYISGILARGAVRVFSCLRE